MTLRRAQLLLAKAAIIRARTNRQCSYRECQNGLAVLQPHDASGRLLSLRLLPVAQARLDFYGRAAAHNLITHSLKQERVRIEIKVFDLLARVSRRLDLIAHFIEVVVRATVVWRGAVVGAKALPQTAHRTVS